VDVYIGKGVWPIEKTL